MEAETLAGLIGFGGAVVGAGGALLGAWFQQSHQAKTARVEREEARAGLVEERGRTAAEKSLAELYGLRRHVLTWKLVSDDERSEWSRIGYTLTDEAELNASLIPEGEELRERLKDALGALRNSISVDTYEAVHEAYASTFDTEHAISLLAAYMRGDALPRPSRREERESLERQMREGAAEDAEAQWDPS
ncbi:hypothetical protein OG379_39825 (plasmid) [Streptomyces sp. NBC_01166]|uniref:hypothetical protein n=1 Tax=Streptomyces sp. NBC_01166 TaxID=2903755 RepID=UPI002F917CC0|nr:hypothetical protein OG379_39825 [Streptomyces sp. NBC_01166]